MTDSAAALLRREAERTRRTMNGLFQPTRAGAHSAPALNARCALLRRDLLEGEVDIDAASLLGCLGRKVPDGREQDDPDGDDLGPQVTREVGEVPVAADSQLGREQEGEH